MAADLVEQAGLADAGRSRDHRQARLSGERVAQPAQQLVGLDLPVDQPALDRATRALRGHRRARGLELRGLVQHLLLERPERRPGVDPQLLGEGLPGPPQRGERVGLPVRAVLRQRQQPPALLAQPVLREQRLELGHDQGALAGVEAGLQQPLARERPELLETAGLGVGPVGAGVLTEDRAAPQRQRLREQLDAPTRVRRRARLDDQPLEAPGVDVDGARGQRVAVTAGDEHPARGPGGPVRLERATQVGDVGLQAGGARRRRLALPQRVEQGRGRHLPATGERQQRHDGPLAAAAEVEVLAGQPRGQRAEQGEGQSDLHRGSEICAHETTSPNGSDVGHPRGAPAAGGTVRGRNGPHGA